MARVAIVGAGIAGLSAARALVAAATKPSCSSARLILADGWRRGSSAASSCRESGRSISPSITARSTSPPAIPASSALSTPCCTNVLVAKWTGRIVAFDDEGWEEIETGTERYVAVPSMSALGAHLSKRPDVAVQRQGGEARAASDASSRAWRLHARDDEVDGRVRSRDPGVATSRDPHAAAGRLAARSRESPV